MANRTDPLVSLIRRYLNSLGSLPDDQLNAAGSANPIAKQILTLGYNNPGLLGAQYLSDKDAIGSAIDALRGGASLTQHLGASKYADNPYKKGTASENILRSLVDERIKAGLSPEEARSSVEAGISGELGTVRTALKHQINNNSSGSSLSDADKAMVGQQVQSDVANAVSGGAGAPNLNSDGQGQFSSSLPEAVYVGDFKAHGAKIPSHMYREGNNPDAPVSNAPNPAMQFAAGADPTNMATEQMLGAYNQRGQADISAFVNESQLLGAAVPEGLQPIYQNAVLQRTQQMQGNLEQYMNNARSFPAIQAMLDTARNLRATGSGSKKGGSKDPLSGLTGGSGSSGGGGDGSGSNGTLNRSLADQLVNSINYGKYLGSSFGRFETPVLSSNQLSFLNSFIPKSKKAYNAVPAYTQFLANQYGG